MNKLNILLTASAVWIFIAQANAMETDEQDSFTHNQAHSNKFKFDMKNPSSEKNRALALTLYRGSYRVMQTGGIDYSEGGNPALRTERDMRGELSQYSVSEEDREYCKRDLLKELQTDKSKLQAISNTLPRTQGDNWWLEFKIENAVKKSIDSQDKDKFTTYLQIFPEYFVLGAFIIEPKKDLQELFDRKKRNSTFNALNDNWNQCHYSERLGVQKIPDNVVQLLTQEMEDVAKNQIVFQSKMREEIAAKDKESDRIRSQMELLSPQKMENAILPAFYNLNHNNIKLLKENAQNLYNLYLRDESMRSHGCLEKLVQPDAFKSKIKMVSEILETISDELAKNPVSIYNDPSVMIKEIEEGISKLRGEIAQTKKELIMAVDTDLIDQIEAKTLILKQQNEVIKKLSQKIESISAEGNTKSLSRIATLEDIMAKIIEKSDHKNFEGK